VLNEVYAEAAAVFAPPNEDAHGGCRCYTSYHVYQPQANLLEFLNVQSSYSRGNISSCSNS